MAEKRSASSQEDCTSHLVVLAALVWQVALLDRVLGFAKLSRALVVVAVTLSTCASPPDPKPFDSVTLLAHIDALSVFPLCDDIHQPVGRKFAMHLFLGLLRSQADCLFEFAREEAAASPVA